LEAADLYGQLLELLYSTGKEEEAGGFRDPYPGKREEKDEQIQSGVDDSEDYGRLEAKRAVLANACERPPVCSEVETAVEDETKEESQRKASSKDNENE
jgi:hypothetical protein